MAKTKSKLGLIIIGIAVALVAALIFVPKLFPESSPPDASGLQTFQSKKFGFSVKHPQGWTVNESNFAEKQEIIISERSKNASVKINAYKDSSLDSEEAVRSAMQRFKQEMDNDPNVVVSQFKTDFQNEIGGHILIGQQIIDGENYDFQNRGLLSTNGRLILFHGVVKQDLANQELKDAINTIIDNFKLE
jgi:hypothetical protein